MKAETNKVLIFLSAFIATFTIATTFLVKHNDIARAEATDASIQCTSEAKMCPDGSFVGRIAPYCQFAACK